MAHGAAGVSWLEPAEARQAPSGAWRHQRRAVHADPRLRVGAAARGGAGRAAPNAVARRVVRGACRAHCADGIVASRFTRLPARSTRARIVLAAGAWTNAIDGIRTPPLRPVRGQLLHLGWRGRPLSSIVWGPECYIVPRAGRLAAGRRDGGRGRIRRTRRPRLAFAICWKRRASCCRKDGVRRSWRRAPVFGPPRRTSCRCSESDPAEPGVDPRVRALSQRRAAGADHRVADRGSARTKEDATRPWKTSGRIAS